MKRGIKRKAAAAAAAAAAAEPAAQEKKVTKPVNPRPKRTKPDPEFFDDKRSLVPHKYSYLLLLA